MIVCSTKVMWTGTIGVMESLVVIGKILDAFAKTGGSRQMTGQLIGIGPMIGRQQMIGPHRIHHQIGR